ncbi:hypothetical protein HXX76_001221 [Chlamydomonas incerta]|uniref:Uncharacterized protein n=1 Tax=Chlamydomonas incerta TaxID=51695 RepID=A0A835WBU6_CHLIN|nr:hypothetical protein HXX76_001221 [Chlamydomonas incerta]|eukprot:KAG2444469.1 hypothetical protein HXX76_001221 [Chlamydomonas incerta]
MLGLFAKSAKQREEGGPQSPAPAPESDDDDDPEAFNYPGMPKAPKPIKLKDPYPGGKRPEGERPKHAPPPGLSGLDGIPLPSEPLVHDGATAVIFVKAGSEHRALLYLMQKVNRLYGLDDLPPDVPPDIAAYHYLVMSAPEDVPVDGDASTDFERSTLLDMPGGGLVVRRVKVLARDPLLAGHVDSTVVARRMPVARLNDRMHDGSHSGRHAQHPPGSPGPLTPGAGGSRKGGFGSRLGPESSAGGAAGDGDRHPKRRLSARRHHRGPAELVPVALPAAPAYMATAAAVIRQFNRSGLIVTPYLYATVVAASAGWWRSHKVRFTGNFGQQIKYARAARRIQRAWRAFMLRSRLDMLAAARRLVTNVGGLLLGANLALTAYHCALLREQAGRVARAAAAGHAAAVASRGGAVAAVAAAALPTSASAAALYPEQRLRFGFDRAGALVLVEPSRDMPKPLSEGTWAPGLPTPPVARSLPLWCGLQVPLCGERAAVSVHGCREVMGLQHVTALLTDCSLWKDTRGQEMSRASLPDVYPPDPAATAATLAGGGTFDDVVLAVVSFPSVHEAALRAALLLAYTWDPRRRAGVQLIPMHQTAAARGAAAQVAMAGAIATLTGGAAGTGEVVAAAAAAAAGMAAGSKPGTPGGGGAAAAAAAGNNPLAWRHVTAAERSSRSSTPQHGGQRSPARGSTPASPLRASRGASMTAGQPHPHPHPGSPTASPARSQRAPSQLPSPAPGTPGSRGAAGAGGLGGSPAASPSGARRSRQAASPAGRGLPPMGARAPSPPPLPMRPGTVPTPPSKFLDLDAMHPHVMAGGAPGASSAGGGAAPVGPVPGLATLQALQRPSTTPLGSARGAGGLMGEVSLASLAAGFGGAASPPRSPAPTVTIVPNPHTDLPQSSLARALSPAAIAHARAVQHGQHEQQQHHHQPAHEPDGAVSRSAGSLTAAVAPSAGSLTAAVARSAGSLTAAAAPGDLAGAAGAAAGEPGLPALPPGSPYLKYDMLSPRSREPATTSGTAAGTAAGTAVAAAVAAAAPGSHPGSPSRLAGGGASQADAVAAEESAASSAALAAAPTGDGTESSMAPFSPYSPYDLGGAAPAPPHHAQSQLLPERLTSPAGVGAEDSLGDLPPGAARSPGGSPSHGRSPSPSHGAGGGARAGAGGEWTPGTEASTEAGQVAATPADRHAYPFPYVLQPSNQPQLPPAVVYLHPSAGGPTDYEQYVADQQQQQQQQQPLSVQGQVPAPAPYMDPYAHMTVLQRHQAMGMYSHIVLLPVPAEPIATGPNLRPEGGLPVNATTHAARSRSPSPPGSRRASDDGARDASGLSLPPRAVLRPGPTDDTPELVVAPMPIGELHVPTLLTELVAAAGEQGRDDRFVADNTARIGRLVVAEERFSRHRQLMSKLMLTQVIGRQTAVGHLHVPGYSPLTSAAMGEIVAEMAAVYRGEAAELVAAIRQQHREAMDSVTEEKAATARHVAATSGMQAAVVDSHLGRLEEERGRAAKARVTRAHMRSLRRERATQDRAFAAAFGRQVASLGKQIVRSEIKARDSVWAAEATQQATLRKALDQQTQEHIVLAADEIAELNRWKAAAVRSEGWTADVADHYNMIDMYQADMVALRRDENYARMRRVGPAGGVWGGGKPRELLRAPLPIASVVSAAAAAAARSASASATSSRASGAAGGTAVGGSNWRTLSGGARSGSAGGEEAGPFAYLPGGTRGSFSSAWPLPFEGDHGSMASSAPASALQSRQTPTRRPLALPEPLPEGYVPGGAATAGAGLAPTAEEGDGEDRTGTPGFEFHGAPPGPWGGDATPEQVPGSAGAAGYPGAAGSGGDGGGGGSGAGSRGGSVGHSRRGVPPNHMVEGPDGLMQDYLPEAYPMQPYGSRQGTAQQRPVGMVVSRY